MTVISMVEAARIAKVSRQAIHVLKKAHLTMRRNYPFFSQDHKSKKSGVDIDHPDWKLYVDRNKASTTKKPHPVKQTRVKSVKPVKRNDAYITDTFIKLMKIVEETIIETIDPSEDDLNNFKDTCLKKCQAVIK